MVGRPAGRGGYWVGEASNSCGQRLHDCTTAHSAHTSHNPSWLEHGLSCIYSGQICVDHYGGDLVQFLEHYKA
ncbi:hypothetical protein GUJ93_ZPchr0006g42879 [Zizania palustris]|uniref:Uncharacterized protein n=1 Tax=Zizania palustris TaxID=103762 RepID=A0A8J5SKJ9_ZIZPA|nr:hypothetical protein GUJ93_ZPchr0006g42879 [Zizania palustris]